MFTVRFPNGQAVQYNTATYASRSTEYTDIYSRKGGTWIAQVPNACIIESVPACRVYNPLADRTDIDERISKELRAMNRRLAKIDKAGK